MENNSHHSSALRLNPCPDLAFLRLYHEGHLNDDETRRIEEHLLDCELCSDALEGIPFILSNKNLDEIDKNKNRVIEKIKSNGKNRSYYFIGSVVLIIVIAFLLQLNHKNNIVESINQPKIPNNKITVESDNKISQDIPLIDSNTTIQTEKIKKTEVKKQRSTIISANKKVFTIPITESIPEVSPVTPPLKSERKRKSSVDAMLVSYMEDLKIINYMPIYEELYERNKMILKNTPAQFEGNNAKIENTNPSDTLYYKQLLKSGLLNYKSGKYREALVNFETIQKIYPDDQNALFYGGLSHFNLGNFEDARRNFLKIMAHENSTFIEETQWNYALSLNELKEFESCKIQLNKIITGSGFYSEKAQKLLKSIP